MDSAQPLMPGDMPLTAHPGRHGRLCHDTGDEVIGMSLAYYGEWAEEEIFLLHHFLRPGMWAIDVGANVGTHALALSRFVTSSGRVIAIDGQERAFRLLALNMFLNAAHHVTSLHAFAGAEHELRMLPETMAPAGNNLGAFKLSVAHAQSRERNEAALLVPVPMIRLDELALPRCDLIKIDVEEMEHAVLRGAERTIEKHRPVIYFEQTGEHFFEETFRLLSGASYRLFWHVANPFNRNNFKRHPENIFGPTRETNVLALPNERSGAVAPEGTTVHKIRGASYEPPVGLTETPGWSLPDSAYQELPALDVAALLATVQRQLGLPTETGELTANDVTRRRKFWRNR